MSTTYTPTPAQLTTLTCPQDAVDDVVVATLNGQTQPLADAVVFQQNAQVWYGYVKAAASPIAANAHLEIATRQGYPAGQWVLSSFELQVPYVGLYRIDVKAEATIATSGATDSSIWGIMVDTVEQAWVTGDRYTTTNTDPFLVAGSSVVYIGTPASEKIWLKNLNSVQTNGAGGSNAAYINPIIVTYLGDST